MLNFISCFSNRLFPQNGSVQANNASDVWDFILAKWLKHEYVIVNQHVSLIKEEFVYLRPFSD